jgi:hypothetical protein
MKLFIVTWRARILRAEAGYSRVRARKTGLPPRGFTMGKRAVRMSRMLLATSSNGESSGTESIAEARVGRVAGGYTQKLGGGFWLTITGTPSLVFCKC